jgi:regulator of cell morphogenesis and NO signaling
MDIQKNQIIGALVAQDYRTASVFKKHGIDFCCQGNRTINDACENKNIDVESVLRELKTVTETNATINYNAWPIELLTDYIEKTHHRYVEQKIQEIKPFLNKIVKVHGDRHPELLETEQLFVDSAGELTAHMKKEEFILFPFIRKMAKAKDANEPCNTPQFETVQSPIAMMLHEHNAEGERFRKIAELTGNYTPPADACNTYRVTFSLLKEFEEDLHTHIHLENNILFPKAIEMEKALACTA